MAENLMEDFPESLLCLFNGETLYNNDLPSDWSLGNTMLPDLGPQLYLLDNGQLAYTNGLQLFTNNLDAKTNSAEMFMTTAFLPLLVPSTCDALSIQQEEESSDAMDTQLTGEVPTDIIDDLVGLDEEFNSLVDIVTTFRCKMCQHSTSSKELLIDHIVSAHIENKEEDRTSEHSNVDPDDPNIPEKMVFLCAQCAEAFDSLEACHLHMVEDHRLVTEEQDKKALSQVLPKSHEKSLENTETVSKNKSEVTKVNSAADSENNAEISKTSTEISENVPKNPASIIQPSSSSDIITPDLPSTDVEQTKTKPREKRKINLPKSLENGYVLGKKDALFRCDSLGCVAKFPSEKELDLHVLCHNTEERAFKCFECRKPFTTWKPCAIHLWRTHQIDVGMLTCKVCGYKLVTPMKLTNHMRIHSTNRSFTCQVCNKAFKQRNQLKNHSVIHADRTSEEAVSSSRWYTAKQCQICNKTYADAKCLKKHVTTVHNKLKPYTCPVCGHTSARKSMMQMHLRQHTGEKPYECNVCSFRTGDHNSLRRHKMRHTGDKPYRCPHCDYACIQTHAYKSHLRNRHPDQEGIFECTECGFRTVSEENYLGHLADHKREEQLEQIRNETFPGNMAAANLIFRCLNKLGDREGCSVRADVTGHHTSADGSMQTITICIPTTPEEEEDDGCIRVEELVRQRRPVEVPDEPDLGGITIPADPPPPPQPTSEKETLALEDNKGLVTI